MSNATPENRCQEWERELESLNVSFPIVAYDVVASTMDVAKELVLVPPYLVLARQQLQGRGRGGKVWQAPDDSLKMTLVLPIHDHRKLASGFSLFVGLVISNFVKELLGVALRVKWPNDLYSSNGQKVGGVLIETTSSQRLLVGVGMNIASVPDAVEATALASLTTRNMPATHLFGALVARSIVDQYQNFLSHGISVSSWAEVGYGINRAVKIYDSDLLKLQGVFRGITERGEALVETCNGNLMSIVSGTLRFDVA